MAGDCIFCKIVRGDVPSSRVHEDDLTFTFLDIRPVNRGHTLVIPKAHAANLAELPPEVGERMFRNGMQVAAAQRRSAIRAEGVNLHLADGRAAGQEVFHVHLHVIPRRSGDGSGFRFGVGGEGPSRDELEETARTLREALS